jgi:hypothetical protein
MDATMTSAAKAVGIGPLTPAHTPQRTNTRDRCACSGETWVVTAPQLQPRRESIDRVPRGDYHVKVNGAGATLCGRSSLTWHVFWNLQPDPLDPTACPDCMDALGHCH